MNTLFILQNKLPLLIHRQLKTLLLYSIKYPSSWSEFMSGLVEIIFCRHSNIFQYDFSHFSLQFTFMMSHFTGHLTRIYSRKYEWHALNAFDIYSAWQNLAAILQSIYCWQVNMFSFQIEQIFLFLLFKYKCERDNQCSLFRYERYINDKF